MAKRQRATRQEMIERLQAKLERLQQQEEGKPVASTTPLGVKRLRASIRKRRTALHRANVLLDGHAGSEKSPAINGIAAKIENAQRRLDQLIEARNRAVEQIENLPGDIERLEAALAQAEAGGEVEMPEGLTMLEASNDAEVEVEAGMGESES